MLVPLTANRQKIHEFERSIFEGDDSELVWEQPARFGTALELLDLTQAIITWGRTAPNLKLRLGTSVSSPARLRESLSHDELLAAALVARQVVTSEGVPVNADVRRALELELSRRRFIPASAEHRTIVLSTADANFAYSADLMSGEPPSASTDLAARTRFFRLDLQPFSLREREMLRGAGEVIARDNSGRDWLTRAAWPPSIPTPTGPFAPLGHRILRPTAAMNNDWERSAHPAGSSPADWLGQALWEVVQNTERHGMETSKVPIPRSLRMLTASPVDASRVPTGSALAMYLARVIDRLGPGTSFVATSVVDSGDGLAYTAAARAGKGSLSEADEIAYLKMAVRGESHSPDRPMHGFGMPVVAQLLSDVGGFIRIRSGSLCVWRDFDEKGTSFGKPDSPLDWAFDLEDASTPHRRFGSVITFVLPRHGAES